MLYEVITHPVAADRGGHREGDPGVARGRLDHGVARPELAALGRLQQQEARDPVLDRAPGVGTLELDVSYNFV